jgi:hypothetical protein
MSKVRSQTSETGFLILHLSVEICQLNPTASRPSHSKCGQRCLRNPKDNSGQWLPFVFNRTQKKGRIAPALQRSFSSLKRLRLRRARRLLPGKS